VPKISSKDEEEETGEVSARPPFTKIRDDISNWVNTAEQSPLGREPEIQIPSPQRVQLPQLESYEEFITKSEAFHWLLTRLQVRFQTYCPDSDTKGTIGSKILHESLHTMRSQAPMPTIHTIFSVNWELTK
jgi:hypothetical protein